jgi:serine/threonine-protein kinase
MPSAPPTGPAAQPAASPVAYPAFIGGYLLTGLIGSGTLADVHLATEPITGQQVALKVLKAMPDATPADRADARRRFLAEAVAARRLSHPDIVRVMAAGEDAGTAWLAMELLGGCDLQRYTRPARLLPDPVVLQVTERVARALAYAHGRGVVHRDVKPANVMVDWAAGRVTLTDFGLARVADAEGSRTGLIVGSPSYMAPEQLAGAVADARGDLYALGVMIFQLLTGRLPHESASLGELLRQVANDPAPDLRHLRPELPAPLARLVAGLLAKSPSARGAGAAAAAEQLAALGALAQAQAPATFTTSGVPKPRG